MVKRYYELMFIVNPELDDEATEALLERVRGYINEAAGTIIKLDDWGMRRLAYTIERQREGRYYLMHFGMDTERVKEFERRLLLAEGILREIIVRLEQEPVAPEPAPAEPEAESEPVEASAPAAEEEAAG